MKHKTSVVSDVRSIWPTFPAMAAVVLSAGCGAQDVGPTQGGEAQNVGVVSEAVKSIKGCDASNDDDDQSNWAMYGQNILGQRCVQSDDLPNAKKAANLQVKWNNAVVSGTTSTPIVKDGHMYYGDTATNFYSVKASNGKVEWQVNLFTAGTVSGFDPIRGSARATEDHVYVATGHKLFKLNRKDGSIVWSHLMDNHFAVLMDSSPTLVDDTVLVGVAGFELAIDVPLRTFRGSVVALDSKTGNELWRTYTTNDDATSGPGVSVWSSVVVDKDRHMAFVGTGNTYALPAAPLADSLLALDTRTGAILWTKQFVAGDIFVQAPTLGPGTDSDVGATANLFTLNGKDVVGVGCKSGEYKIMDRRTGTELKSVHLATGPTAYVGGIMDSAAVANGIIYVNSNVWQHYTFPFTGAQDPADTSVTYAVDAATGNILWTQPLPAPHFGGVTKVNDVIYHTLIDGHLVGLNAADGSVVLNAALPAPAGGGVSTDGEKLYVGYGLSFRSSPVPVAGVEALSLP